MPFFKSKKPKLTSEERIAKKRVDSDNELARDRAKFDAKNIDFKLVPAEIVSEVRATTDSNITELRSKTDLRLKTEQNPDLEQIRINEALATIDILGIERRTLMRAETEERNRIRDAESAELNRRLDAQLEENDRIREARLEAHKRRSKEEYDLYLTEKPSKLAQRVANKATSQFLHRNLALIKAHNRRILGEVKDDIIGIKNDFIEENRRISKENQLKRLETEFGDLPAPEDIQIRENPKEVTNKKSKEIPEITLTFSDPLFLTFDNFNKIYEGMPLADVIALFDAEGNVYTYPNNVEGRVWIGAVVDECKVKGLLLEFAISVVFRDGLVIAKHEAGVKKNKL